MRRINHRGLVAAMESEEEAIAATAAVETTPEIVIGDNAESLETDLIEIAEGEADTAEAEASVDEAVEVAEALESISEGLRAAAGAGGLSKEGAHVVGICVDHLYGRVGVRRAVAMPALESFGSTSSRVQATTIAYEEIKEQAKALWAKIVAAIEKSIAWLKEKFELFFGTAGKVKARADGLVAKAAAVSGEAKSKEIDNARLFASLQASGKVDLESTLKLVEGATNSLFATAGDRVKALAEFVDGKEDALVKIFNNMDGGALKDVSSPDQEGFKLPKEGFKIKRTDELPGGKAVVAIVPADSKSLAEDLAHSSFGISAYKPNAKAPTEAKLPTLSPAEVGNIAKQVADLADAFQKHKVASFKANDDKKNLIAAIKKHGGDAKTEEEQKAAKAARATLTAISKLIDNPIAGGSAYILNTCKAVLDYSEESLKQFAAAPKAAPAAAEAAAA